MSTEHSWDRWLLPLMLLVLAGALLAASTLGGDAGAGVAGLVVVAAYGVFLVLGRRLEPVALLARVGTDERRRAIGERASRFTGEVLMWLVVVMILVELADGRDGSPWTSVGAVAAVAYVGALVWFSRRM